VIETWPILRQPAIGRFVTSAARALAARFHLGRSRLTAELTTVSHITDTVNRVRVRQALASASWRQTNTEGMLVAPDPGGAEAAPAVLYVTGHGLHADGQYWIVLHGSGRDRLHSTAQRSADLVAWLKETRIKHLLILLDLCHAGGAAHRIAEFDRDLPRGWLPLAAVTSSQTAKVGVLSGAIATFLAELDQAEGERFNHGPFLRTADFVERVQHHLGDDQTLALLYPAIPLLGQHLCLPNPRWQPDDQPVTPARPSHPPRGSPQPLGAEDPRHR